MCKQEVAMIFITGASGFIGKALIRRLIDDNQSLIILTRDSSTYGAIGDEIIVEGDLSDIDSIENQIKQYSIDTMIHLAWEGIPDYEYEMSARNLRYGLNALDICKRQKIRNLIITGSCWEYKTPYGMISTSYELEYGKCFPTAKNSLHAMASVFCKENNIRFNWLRLFYVYGPGQRKGSLIPHILDCFSRGEYPQLNGAYNCNDFVYVDDVAEMITRVVDDSLLPEIINVGTGKAERVLDVVRDVAGYFDLECEEPVYENNKSSCFFANPDEIINNVGWIPSTDVKEGIKKTVHNLLKNSNPFEEGKRNE